MGAEPMKPRIVLVPFPAQGHVTPMLHLAHAIQSHGFTTTLAVPDFIHHRLTTNANLSCSPVELVSIPSGKGDRGELKDFQAIVNAMENYMPGRFEEMLRGYRAVACVVVDLLASWAIPVAKQCSFAVAGFWPAMMASYKIISAIPTLMQKGIISESGIPLCNDDIELSTELNLDNDLLVKLTSKELPWLVGDSATCKSRFNFWLKIIDRTRTLKFILNNSFPGEEGKIDKQFQNNIKNSPQVLQVGPLLKYNNSKCNNPTMWQIDSTCLKWLNLQPERSVIYVSFGSWVGPIGSDKIKELALGLANSGRPFLWVLKKERAWQSGLPEGFIKRIEGCGKIVEWVPQEEVLKHKSIGCYITHCGWNSTLEAIQHAKPQLCYPISGDQFINCSCIVKVWGIGIKLYHIEQHAVQGYIEKVIEGKDGKKMLERVIALRRNVMEGSASEEARNNLGIFIDYLRRDVRIC
ncbi:hypothetical protein LUZ63_001841 [Rhynchospora breviuscula]|uniref:Glycosyltransferase n=1 Tax=Rhynchospora breviuscula TaxID=2022672 RepID=A0A9Q0CXM5_9POAL|nr:hypothetical protein LUZ63_001841 [Rhynchospora breviuscula]